MDSDFPCTDMCKADCENKVSSLLSMQEESSGINTCEDDMLDFVWIIVNLILYEVELIYFIIKVVEDILLRSF